MGPHLAVILLALTIGGAVCFSDQFETLKSAPRVKRVIGGHDISEGRWPWLVHLKGKIPTGSWWRRSYKLYYCGGSIINKRWILTAAHCFKPNDPPKSILKAKYWHIKAGEVERKHDIFDNMKSFVGWVFQRDDWRLWYVHASHIITHPEYNANANWRHDIALVRLDEDLPIGPDDPNVAETTLPEASATSWPGPGTECVMKGWGCTENGGPLADTAQQVALPAKPTSLCSSIFGEMGESRLCAGLNLADKGICAGDSGGPLVCKKDNTWIQAGIASFTSGSRPGDVPGVFTRVSYYRNWIDKTIRDF